MTHAYTTHGFDTLRLHSSHAYGQKEVGHIGRRVRAGRKMAFRRLLTY